MFRAFYSRPNLVLNASKTPAAFMERFYVFPQKVKHFLKFSRILKEVRRRK